MRVLDSWLLRFDPEVRELVHALRTVVRETLPESEEGLRPGWGLIGYRTRAGSRGRYLGFVSPQDDCALLGLEWGTLIDDPSRLLAPRGNQVAVYRGRPGERLPTEELAILLRQAATLAELPSGLRRDRLAGLHESSSYRTE